MDNKDLPAFPPNGGWEHPEVKGLTKREYIATMIDISGDIDNFTPDFCANIIGKYFPLKGTNLEKIQFWAEVQAKLKVIKADALLTELSKP